MRKFLVAAGVCALMACTGLVWTDAAVAAGNVFNPYMQQRLPAQTLQKSDLDLIAAMGGKPMNLQDEASHRPHWREEAYPVVFGNRTGQQEVLVLLDYAVPQSAVLWQEILRAVPKLDPYNAKIVVLGRSSEKYGTELMGTGIWIATNRAPQAMDFFTYTLNRWNEVKQIHKQRGQRKAFVYEYDATASSKDYPMGYTYLQKLRPPVPANVDADLMRYAYDAGNVNLYQAVSVMAYYGVKQLPAVVVNGTVLANVTADSIAQAARK